MGRDGPLVVDHIEDDGGFEGRGKVECIVIVALSRRSIAKPRDAHLIVALVSTGHGHANGLGKLGADRGRNGNEATFFPSVVNGHLASADIVFRVPDAVADHADHVSSSNKLCAGLAIGGEKPILFFKGHGLSDGNGLFTKGTHVEREFTGSLHLDHSVVKDSKPHHVFESLNQGLFVEVRVPFAFCLSVVVEHADEASCMGCCVFCGA